MSIQDRFPKSGWRRIGAVNLLLIFFSALVLLGCVLANVFASPPRPISTARILYQGDCTAASRINLVLHLFINVLSTCVLASSNFFMQILSAPSRKEIDKAHQVLCGLEIGVPSLKNIFFLSNFKRIVWFGLFLSSVPVHLLFNSVVYETNFEGSSWHLGIATEAFVEGTGHYFGPGASLSPSGFPGPTFNNNMTNIWYGLGEQINLAQYWDDSSPANQTMKVVESAVAGWKNLTPSECFSEYRFCKPRKEYRNMTVVVDGVGPGWVRSEIFDFDTNSNLSQLWDAHIPPRVANSLWRSLSCFNQRVPDERSSDDGCNQYGQCAGVLGDPTAHAWVNTTTLSGSIWTIPVESFQSSYPTIYGFNQSFSHLNVAYCLAEPNPDYKCKVGASTSLLLVVALCVFAKVFLGALTLWKIPHTSLVTLGDAMESFISCPDAKTVGLGTINIRDSRRIEFQKQTLGSTQYLIHGPRPRRWHGITRRYVKSVISKGVWIRTYSLLTAGVILLVVALTIFATTYGPSSVIQAFGSSDNNTAVNIFYEPPSYVTLLLAANSPQIILSFCYFSFNAFFTRTQTEQEWNSYSLEYKPLRVSHPTGSQTSSYRLQLPYRYSLPLLGVSIGLHWILSNAIFIYIVEGNFWDSSYISYSFDLQELGVSEDALVAMGVSGLALLIMTLVSALLCCIPIAFSYRKVPGTMVAGGSNSLVLSAACHASVMARRHWELTNTSDSAVREGSAYEESNDGNGQVQMPAPSMNFTRGQQTAAVQGYNAAIDATNADTLRQSYQSSITMSEENYQPLRSNNQRGTRPPLPERVSQTRAQLDVASGSVYPQPSPHLRDNNTGPLLGAYYEPRPGNTRFSALTTGYAERYERSVQIDLDSMHKYTRSETQPSLQTGPFIRTYNNGDGNHSSSVDRFQETHGAPQDWQGQSILIGSGALDENEVERLLGGMSLSARDEKESLLLRKLTLGKIKWGSMALDSHLQDSVNMLGIDEPVRHLGMGTEEDDVQPPRQGHWYI
ncbi:hypothetical protein M406DRAFT_74077 [Cryphonectria parasitica EP155]|uniref:DUF6536 domain-containing protein n=1 Tax=Cryphonectria parasitica (strain ATCC 38755 / EP155) TaxID=660469 RepID=A0A9P4XY32_CRYP1|nr:uncharacterized protein M406DRAFT_74077 [Cryphonectria parasitica EP155]KAF3763462.1 hypothetical protein M406DRAFT_74077 [Cryphonectria parasitica EP155]